MSQILIVDDSSLARRSLRKMLEDLGHTVDEASDGAEALERYSLERHDLVFLDIVMKGMFGSEVLEKLLEMNGDARIIMATADIQTSTRDQLKTAGAAALVNKPFNRPQLDAVVKKVLSEGSAWN